MSQIRQCNKNIHTRFYEYAIIHSFTDLFQNNLYVNFNISYLQKNPKDICKVCDNRLYRKQKCVLPFFDCTKHLVYKLIDFIDKISNIKCF